MEPYNPIGLQQEAGLQTREYYKRQRAKKRVQQIKGFHVHLAVFIVINGGLLLGLALRGPESEWHVMWSPGLWALGLGFHALHVYCPNWLLGRSWEERQIQKYMAEEERQAEKFTSES